MVWGGIWFIPGIIVGIVTVSLAYSLHVPITEAERKKIAPEIIRLTAELMK